MFIYIYEWIMSMRTVNIRNEIGILMFSLTYKMQAVKVSPHMEPIIFHIEDKSI